MKEDFSYSSFAFRVGKYCDRKKYEENYDKINWNKKKKNEIHSKQNRPLDKLK